MTGWTDYTAQNIANYESGSLAMPALPSVWLALFTTPPTDEGATSGTEVSGNGYARQQIAGPLTTNAATASGATLHFASVPSWILGPSGTGVVGMQIRDATTASVIPSSTTLVSATSTTVVMSNSVSGGGVANGDTITFSAFAPAFASSGGSESALLPGGITNTNAIITFAQATGTGWGTVAAFAGFDAVTSGNRLWWDYLGAFKWIPFTCTNASPGVLTADSAADAPATSAIVAVTQKYGGTLPTTSGSWAYPLTATLISGATFSVAVNTTSIGGGTFRQVTQQPIAGNVTASFNAGQLTITDA